MTEPERPALHESVFVQLVTIMLAMAASLLVLVGAFYFLIVIPGIHTSASRFAAQHVKALAALSPDQAAARRLADSVGIQMRYEGPQGSWATADDLPAIDAVLGTRHHFMPRRIYYVVPVAGGGRYLFAHTTGAGFYAAHQKLVILLMAVMAGVIVAAYVVMRRMLRPLRRLDEGVKRLSEGQLDVVVPDAGRDEFGVLTRAFNQMAGRVKAMVLARDQLLLDVSHELRSPLTRIKVDLALLPDGVRKTSMTADVAEMETMVTELLERERLRDGRGVRLERQDLVPILREAAESFRDRPPGVRFDPPAFAAPLELDGAQVRTVIRNVIENALKYSLPDSRAVELSVAREGGRVSVRIADDGPGIPESDRESLFEPFFRTDRSRSRKTGGYGLGLSICRRIMEAHGGAITVEDRAERGTSFVLRFPAPG